jgi:hypothetical protein
MRKKLFLWLVVFALLPVLSLSAGISEISLQIDNETAYVNGVSTQLDSPPIIINGRTMVPIRFITESMGAEVGWDGQTKTVTISQETPDIYFDDMGYNRCLKLIESADESVLIQLSTEMTGIQASVIEASKTCPQIHILSHPDIPFDEEKLEIGGVDVRWTDNKVSFCVIDNKTTLTIPSSEDGIYVELADISVSSKLMDRFKDSWDLAQESIEREDLPPLGFINVSPNPKFGITEPFYVSKYEMKIEGMDKGDVGYNESYVAESRPDGTPWTGLTQVEAKKACEALGEGYSLITNDEWMTIAHNIESVERNWSDYQTHKAGRSDARLNVGNVCRYGNRGTGARIGVGQGMTYYGEGVIEASDDDEQGCYGYKSYKAGVFGDVPKPDLDKNRWNEYRRTHYLSNSEVIWDFSGNVWEWTDWYVEWAEDRARIDGKIDENYLEINACNTFSEVMKAEDIQSLNPDITDTSRYTGENYYPEGDDMFGIKADKYTNYNRLGRFHPTTKDRTAGVAMRGCSCMHGDSTGGIYSIAMGYGPNPDHVQCKVGFRCVWRPPSN